MSDHTAEREALEEGTGSAFWKLLCEYMAREWGPGGVAYQSAVMAAAESDNARIELQKILHTQREIARCMRWPIERLNTLTHELRHPAEQTMSRRGPSL